LAREEEDALPSPPLSFLEQNGSGYTDCQTSEQFAGKSK